MTISLQDTISWRNTKARNVCWESAKVSLAVQYDKGHRQRRVQVSCEPTTKELALELPQKKKAVTRRNLQDEEEDQCHQGIDPLGDPREFTVTGENRRGRRDGGDQGR